LASAICSSLNVGAGLGGLADLLSGNGQSQANCNELDREHGSAGPREGGAGGQGIGETRPAGILMAEL
jgi:hypothetical protein